MKSRKDLIKNIAIVFLVIMLLLTFFSNTIMNWSLPQVSGKYTEYGEIKTGVRGSGTVISEMTYTESVKGLRTVEAVYVNRGTEVQKGDLLMLFSATEVEGIEALEAEIASMQEAYDRAMLGQTDTDYSSEELTIKNAKEDLEELKAERAFYSDEYVADVKKAAEDAETAVNEATERVEDLEEEIEEISEHSSEPEIVAARQAVETQTEVYDNAVAAHEKALKAVEESTYTDVSSLESQLDSMYSQLDSLEIELKYIKEDNAYVLGLENDVANTKTAMTKAEDALKKAREAYERVQETSPDTAEESDEYKAMVAAETAYNNAKTTYDEAVVLRDSKAEEIKLARRAIQQKSADIEDVELSIYSLRSAIGDAKNENRMYEGHKNTANLRKQTMDSEKAKLDELTKNLEAVIKKYNKSVTEELKTARKALERATEVKTEADKRLAELSVIESLDEQIKSSERSLESMELSLEQRKNNDANADKLAEYDLKKQLNAINQKRSELSELKGQSKEPYELRATHSGTVTEVNFRAGEIASDGSAAVVVEVTESGYTLSFSVSNSEAVKVKIGDTATVSDTYWGQNAGAVLTKIVPDAGGRTKTLTFEISGNVNVGQNLTLTVGERSTGYSSVIPKTALREDSKGKFIYITKTKSTPLGNRYVATRLDVTVAAEDDKNVAIVTDDTYIYEYVIVSSTMPFEEGDYVRLSE